MILVAYITLQASSVFTYKGTAEINYARDVYGQGMGGTGIGDLLRINTSLQNPALSTTLDKTYFATGLSMGYTTYSDIDKNTFKDDQIFLPYLYISFPYKNNRFGINFSNISSGSLDTEKEGFTNFNDPEEDPIKYRLEQNVSFSLYQAGIFHAYKSKIMNVGIALNYIIGHRIEYTASEFPREHNLVNSMFELDQSFSNPTFVFGIAKEFETLSAGASYTLPVELKGESTFKSNLTTDPNGDAYYDYPASLAFGMAWKPITSLSFSTDFDYQQWKDTDNFPNPVNTTRIGAGLAWTGASRSNLFFTKIPARFGMSYRNLPFTINDSKINEIAYHFGLSIPLKQSENSIDFALKLFERGDANKHDYEESGFLLSIGTQGFDFLRKPQNRKEPRDIPKPSR